MTFGDNTIRNGLYFRAMRYYDYPSKEKEDVQIELVELENVKYGDPFKARIKVEVNMCTNESMFNVTYFYVR